MKQWSGLSGRVVSWLDRTTVRRPLFPVLALLSLLFTGCERLPLLNCDDFPADCDPPPDTPPAGVNTCDLSTYDSAASASSTSDPSSALTGICIPHVDAGWHTALVKMAFPDEGPLQCPESAQWAGLFGREVTDPAIEPRNVIGCSVNPLATCSSLSWACVPFEPDFAPCVLQTNQETCPDPYAFEAKVTPKGGGAPATVCCTRPKLE